MVTDQPRAGALGVHKVGQNPLFDKSVLDGQTRQAPGSVNAVQIEHSGMVMPIALPSVRKTRDYNKLLAPGQCNSREYPEPRRLKACQNSVDNLWFLCFQSVQSGPS
jgi:hypothetical protein